MSQTFFIAGTDTGVGKTTVGSKNLKSYSKNGLSTLGLKPVASGCDIIDGSLKNEDALTLLSASTIKLAYEKINPFSFAEPIAPHIAAQKSEQKLSVDNLLIRMEEALSIDADIKLIEGVGSWCVPLNEKELMSDFVKALNMKVILVVGMRVGCLSHSILTFKNICDDGIELAGWVANCIDPSMAYIDENIQTIENYFGLACQEVVEFSA